MSAGEARLGRYVIERELGRGAMGVVYRARDPRIDRLVALKTLIPDTADPAQVRGMKERFLNEGRAAGRLSHPGVVAVYDADEDPATGTAYLAMEYVDGPDMRRLLRDGLSPERLVQLLREVAAALDHAHQRGVVHRDVKPANIMVDAMGRARLTDFGIARLGSSSMTRAGEFLGTPAYMAPEQITGGAVGPASDVFALGVLLHEGLTGRRPFEGDSVAAMTHAIVHSQPLPPSRVRASVPPAFDAVLARALAKRPEDRFPTAGALGEAAAAALASGGGPALASRRKAAAIAVAALLIGLPALIVATRLARRGAAGEPGAASGPSAASASPASSSSKPSTKAAAKPAPRPAAKSARPAPTGTLAVTVSSTRAGVLSVSADGKELGRVTIEANTQRGPKAIGSIWRERSGSLTVPAGPQRLRFTFTSRDGAIARRDQDLSVRDGGTLALKVDVGMRGKDLDIKTP